MPGIDGYAVCAQIKKDARTSDVPVIFLSALSEAKDKIKGLEIGGVDYIIKPYDKGEVLARVRNQLNIQRLTREIVQANKALVEKQRHLDEDLRAAADIQQCLLPKQLPAVDNFDIAWKFLPCEHIGGDIFNVFRMDEDHLGLYMLDVSGHGVPSAMITVSVSQMLQLQSGYVVKQKDSLSPGCEITSPGSVLRALNQEYPLERFEKYFTIVYLVMNVREGSLVYSSAAHPPPILLHPDGQFELLEKGGTIIGLDSPIPFEEGQIKLQRGDKIILYTDGVPEFQNSAGDIYGEDRFYALLKTMQGRTIHKTLDAVIESLIEFGNQSKPVDDVSLLGIEFKGSP